MVEARLLRKNLSLVVAIASDSDDRGDLSLIHLSDFFSYGETLGREGNPMSRSKTSGQNFA